MDAMTSLARSSPEFGRLMRRLIPRIAACFPIVLRDGGHLVLRARFALDLVAPIPEARGLENCSQILQCKLVVDLLRSPSAGKIPPACAGLEGRRSDRASHCRRARDHRSPLSSILLPLPARWRSAG